MKPNRSDAHPSPEESAKIEERTRQYFDSIAPKRHPKPSRSEHNSSSIDDTIRDHDSNIPELQKLEDLKSNPQKVDGGGRGNKVTEEYVETEYYNDLNCIDKQHHTTGTGFIKVEMHADVGSYLDLSPVSSGGSHQQCSNSYKGNPATNDW